MLIKNYYWLISLFFMAASCKLQPDADRSYDKFDENKVYKLQVNPSPGSTYHYEMENKTETKMEVEEKEVNTINQTEVGFNYLVETDSTGNFIFTTTYDKIKVTTQNGDDKTQADASNAMISIDPVEKMLGILKSARIVATVSPKGEMKNVSGYKELEDKLMAGFDPTDHYSKSIAQAQWKKVVSDGVIKNTMDQLFKIFPDSSIHLHDTWKLNSTEGGEIPMNIKTIYTLKAINNDIAILSSEGIMTSNQSSNSVMGYTQVAANLKGEQKGEFEIETKTGMLISSRITANIEGNLQVMGRDIPIAIKSSIKMNGTKSKNDSD